MTISAWIKLAAGALDQKIGTNQSGSAGGYKMGVFTNDKVEFEVRNSANQDTLNRDIAGGTVLTPGIWYHVVGVYSQEGNYIRTYVDGNLDRELITAAVLGASSGTLKLGREGGSAGYFFNGSFDDVRVYNYVLTHGEILHVGGHGTLYVPVTSPANVYDLEPATQKSVSFKDYAVLIGRWLDEDLFP